MKKLFVIAAASMFAFSANAADMAAKTEVKAAAPAAKTEMKAAKAAPAAKAEVKAAPAAEMKAPAKK